MPNVWRFQPTVRRVFEVRKFLNILQENSSAVPLLSRADAIDHGNEHDGKGNYTIIITHPVWLTGATPEPTSPFFRNFRGRPFIPQSSRRSMGGGAENRLHR